MNVVATVSVALFSALVGYYIKVIEAQRSSFQSRYDDIIAELKGIQLCAKQYWSKTRTQEMDQAIFLEAEGEIVGRFRCIFAIYSIMVSSITAPERDLIQAQFKSVFDAATGGGFRDGERSADANRILSVYATTGLCISLLRASSDYRFSLPFMAHFFPFDKSHWTPG